jgi:LPXTG-motif cell wall-anchored protein
MLTVAVALAVPAGALAQGAGSDQYQDPLAGQPGAGTGSGGGNGTSGGGNGGNGNAGTPAANTTQAGTADGTGTTSAQARDQLPATGADAWLLALAGVTLLGGGLGLRRAAAAGL